MADFDDPLRALMAAEADRPQDEVIIGAVPELPDEAPDEPSAAPAAVAKVIAVNVDDVPVEREEAQGDLFAAVSTATDLFGDMSIQPDIVAKTAAARAEKARARAEERAARDAAAAAARPTAEERARQAARDGEARRERERREDEERRAAGGMFGDDSGAADPDAERRDLAGVYVPAGAVESRDAAQGAADTGLDKSLLDMPSNDALASLEPESEPDRGAAAEHGDHGDVLGAGDGGAAGDAGDDLDDELFAMAGGGGGEEAVDDGFDFSAYIAKESGGNDDGGGLFQ